MQAEETSQPIIPPEHLSIIITTSPIKSHPSTQLIDDSITCINQQPALRDIHIYIVCDGVKIYHENKYKSGAITAEFLNRYNEYKAKLRELYGTQPDKYTIIERTHRHGFADNIRFVMAEHAKTDHVLIYQHDHIIDGYIDFYKTVKVLREQPSINYVTFMNKSYISLIPKICSHLPTRDFLLGVVSEDKESFNVIRNTEEFTKKIVAYFEEKFGLGLIPLNFWYDKVHIAKRKYYLDVIFSEEGNYDPHLGKMQKTVSFVEDTFGHCMKWSILENPAKMLEYGAYIVWSPESVFYHNSGRAFLTLE